jgi:hypothetical protein
MRFFPFRRSMPIGTVKSRNRWRKIRKPRVWPLVHDYWKAEGVDTPAGTIEFDGAEDKAIAGVTQTMVVKNELTNVIPLVSPLSRDEAKGIVE